MISTSLVIIAVKMTFSAFFRPPKPNFHATQERLHRMGEREARGGRENFARVGLSTIFMLQNRILSSCFFLDKVPLAQMKQDLEADYLAAFKKTVAQHEAFLKRLASHSKFR